MRHKIKNLPLIMNPILFCLYLYLFLFAFHSDFGNANATPPHLNSQESYNNFKHRKLMPHGVCSKWDLSISQSRYPSSGIPEFIVQIVNTCFSGCAPSNIHLRCGWFASARIVNPSTFKRVSYDDCLVNGGQPLKTSQSIRFTYANSFMYPLEFKSASFC